ncbi:MAG: DUF2231 domain-containing protein, partial [Nitratireductor sp.]
MRIELLHPAIVHFPIVLAISLLAVDGTATFRGAALTRGKALGNLAAVISVTAAIFALLAFALGDQAYDIAVAAGAPGEPLEMHEELGTMTALAILGWGALRAFGWWRAIPISGARSWIVTAIDGVLAVLVVLTAWYGGQLVYDFGVAVTRATGAS